MNLILFNTISFIKNPINTGQIYVWFDYFIKGEIQIGVK